MALRKEKQAPVATTEAEANAITINVSEKIETEMRTDSLAEKAEAVVVEADPLQGGAVAAGPAAEPRAANLAEAPTQPLGG